jgi:hypothetical protein
MKMKKLLFALFVVGLMSMNCADNKGSEEESNQDYIDIVSVEPVAVAGGEEVSFTITCDVRLASETSGSIFIGFNSNLEHSDHYIVKEIAIFSEPYEGRMTFDLADLDFYTHPIFYEEPENYNIYVNLSPLKKTCSGAWAPLSVDTWPMTVNEGANQINDEIIGCYAVCDFTECNGFYNSDLE